MEECCPAVDVKVRDTRGDFLHSLDSLAFSFYNEHDSKASTPWPFLQNKQIESNPMLSAVSWERLRLPTVYLFQLLLQNYSWWLSFLMTSQYKKSITSCPALCMECIVYSLGAHSCVFSNPAAFMLRPVSSWHCKTWSNNRRAEDEAASAPAHPCVYGKFTNDFLIRRCPHDVFWLGFFFLLCVSTWGLCVSQSHIWNRTDRYAGLSLQT